MPIKYLPKALLSAIIGAALFMNIMPNSITGMSEWIFYLALAGSLLIGWLVATGIFRAGRWYLNRLNH